MSRTRVSQAKPRKAVRQQKRGRGRGENIILSDYARALLDAGIGKEGATAAAFAQRWGLTPSYISQLRDHKVGLGWAAAECFAKAFSRSVPEFVADAYLWDKNGRGAVEIAQKVA